MGIDYCLSTLKSTAKLLSKTSIIVDDIYEKRLAYFNTLMQDDPKKFIIPILREETMALDNLTFDVATVMVLVQKYQLVNAGLPLSYEGIDRFTPTPDDEEDGIIRSFMIKTAGGTGLVPIMEDTIRDEEITDEEIFSTYAPLAAKPSPPSRLLSTAWSTMLLIEPGRWQWGLERCRWQRRRRRSKSSRKRLMTEQECRLSR